jgi:membrane-bound lytic murein transglycosylase F
MPGTFEEWRRALRWDDSAQPTVPSYCINGGAWYMGRLRSQWSAKRSEDDRRRLAQASYNAGFGNILKAQVRCKYAASWAEISPCLVRVTGRYSRETITYVQRIEFWFWQMQ